MSAKHELSTILAVAVAGVGVGAMNTSPAVAATPQEAVPAAVSTPNDINSAADLPNTVELSFPGSQESGGEGHSKASASAAAKGEITILSYIKANGLPKRYVKKDKCFWAHGVENSGETINGPVHPTSVKDVDWFYDSRWTYVCKVPKSISPSGLAKAGNSPTGKPIHNPKPDQLVDNCGNFIETKIPKHAKVVKGTVILERDIAKAKLNLSEKVSVEAIGRDENGDICGEASASASASEKVSLEEYLKSGEGSKNIAVRFYDKLLGKVSVKASAEVNCGTTTVTPTPTISISKLTTAEALYPGTTEQICVDVESSDGTLPGVDWSIYSGEGTVQAQSYEDQDGDPNHECTTFTSGPDAGQTEIDATATDGSATPVTAQFTIATQQDSGF